MLGGWRGLGLLLLVPWMASCVSGPRVRLDTGEGAPIVHALPAAEPPPVQVRQEELVQAMTELVLHMPLRLSLSRREGRVVFASWGGERDALQQMLRGQCSPMEPEQGCLVLPENVPSLETLERLRLALSFAMDSVWEGAAVPLGEFVDPVAFKVMVYTAMSTWLLTLMMPEPVTKGLAAVLTVYLVAYLGLGPVWSMVKAGWVLLEEAERARTVEEVKQAGHRFGRVLGDNGMRVFLLLATAAIGGQTHFVGRGPGLPGFRQAALASAARTRVRLEAAGQVRTVVLGARELVVGLAPTAVASSALGPGGGQSSALPNSNPSAVDTASVRPPAPRHHANRVDQRTLAKDLNSVMEPRVDVSADISAMKAGRAQVGRTSNGELSYSVNGRTYGAHSNGTLYPIQGDGIHVLDRGAFKALGVYNQLGDTSRAAQILDRMGIGAGQRAKALGVWNTYQ